MKKMILAALLLFSATFFSPLVAQPAYAACPTGNSPKAQVLKGTDTTGSDCKGEGVQSFIKAVVNILGIVAGIAGIIMIILSGFRYITSGGESGRVSTAKNSLIYALIGLAIAALSQWLVHFVLFQASDAVK